MKDPDVLIIRYGEMALKSEGVRRNYENILLHNIRSRLKYDGIRYSNIRKETGRIFIYTDDSAAIESISKVFGVVSVSSAFTCDSKIEEIQKLAGEIGKNHIKPGESFAIRARRSGNHQFTSTDVAKLSGDSVWTELKKLNISPKVDLKNPDREIFIEVRQKISYIYTESLKGPGGFPSGTQGKMVSLFSSGIDSPVASWLMMKRGVVLILIYIDTYPFTAAESFDKVLENAKQIFSYDPGRKHTLIRVFHEKYMKEIIENATPKNRCILCKRSMYKIADIIRKKYGASGIISGSSLGQVASQTAKNMEAETYNLSIPLYHPLIAFDKQEIIDIAQKIGTYEISIRPTGSLDCLMVPEKPQVSAEFDLAEIEESAFDESLIDEILEEEVNAAEIYTFNSENLEVKLEKK
ncbi:MAG: tRNA 4-thiouridine(8) synthase ThiI [Methanosarcinaceae archaeon]|nr:tRNA 4-thiouridine(8) synthase ThiI [Methanosarcinaceae archaeon]